MKGLDDLISGSIFRPLGKIQAGRRNPVLRR